MAFYAAIYHYDPADTDLDRVRPRHRRFTGHLFEEGKIVASGPFTDGDGGALLLFSMPEETTLADVRQLIKTDPFVVEGIVTSYEVHSFNPATGSLGG